MRDNVAPSPVTENGIVYLMGGDPKPQTVAIRAGGEGDVTASHMLWSSLDSSYIPSPVLHKGHLYWVSDMGIANCVEAKTGKSVYRQPLPRAAGAKPYYASVILSGERLYAVSRLSGTYVLPEKPTFEILAHNRIVSDSSSFNASPAIGDGQMMLRSNRFIYCIETK